MPKPRDTITTKITYADFKLPQINQGMWANEKAAATPQDAHLKSLTDGAVLSSDIADCTDCGQENKTPTAITAATNDKAQSLGG